MGCSPKKSCNVSPGWPAPNPDPSRWVMVRLQEFSNGYAAMARYSGCTNYGGLKVMVYRGKYVPCGRRDPHFEAQPESPVARFRPDEEGWAWALSLAASL